MQHLLHIQRPISAFLPSNRALEDVVIHNAVASVGMNGRQAPRVSVDTTVAMGDNETPQEVIPVQQASSSSPQTNSDTDEKSAENSEINHPPTLHHINGKVPIALSQEIDGLIGVSSEEYERYRRNIIMWVGLLNVLKKDNIPFVIQPLTLSFSPILLRPTPPNDWVAYVHPEGMRYFFDDSREIPVLTDAYLYDPIIHQKIDSYIKRIDDYVLTHNIALPDRTHLVLEFRNSGRCGYYFVNHMHQCLFWLDEFDISYHVDEVKIDHSVSHIGLKMYSLYWLHNELFPHAYNLTTEDLDEIEDIVRFAIGDTLTSSSSTVTYSIDTLKSMLSLITDFQRQCSLPDISLTRGSFSEHDSLSLAPGASCTIARFFSAFYEERYINLFGEKGARLNVDQSIHPKRRNTFLIKCLSPFLLYEPVVHLRNLKRLTTDCTVNKIAMGKHIEKVINEWKEIILYATVILNANVAFLTIQSIDNEPLIHRRSNAQRASYCSIVASMGTIIFGLVLVRQHKEAMNIRFFSHRSASGVGLETLALMYSLPYALLMWSMVSFLAAFSISWYQSRDPVVIVLITSAWFVLALLLSWCISVAYEDRPYYWPWPFRAFLHPQAPKLSTLLFSPLEKWLSRISSSVDSEIVDSKSVA